MDSTMQDFPLTITAHHAARLRCARRPHGHDRDRRRVPAHAHIASSGSRQRQLANALRRIGITGDQRVATFMWNNAEHLAAYLAVPSMGAVLHTLNIRLSPEQIAFIANEAEDQVILVDVSLAGQLAPVLPLLETVHTVIAVGEGDIDAADGIGQDRAALRRGAGRGVARASTGPTSTRSPRPRCATPAAPPETRKALSTAIVRVICTRWRRVPQQRYGGRLHRQGAADRADVPRQRVGVAVRGVDGGRRPGDARPLPRRRSRWST